MKNVIKKIAATAMAFTLLGTGATVTNKMSTKTNTGLVAHAACSHTNVKRTTYSYVYVANGWGKLYYTETDYCPKCGYTFNSYTNWYWV